MNSHHDTVEPNSGYTIDPFKPIVKDEKLYGRGGADNFNDISTQQFGVNGSVINYYDGFARTQGDAGWVQIYDANGYIAFSAEL